MHDTRAMLGFAGLSAATYLVVSGGPHGLEEIIKSCGYSTAVIVLLVTPLLWSLPICLLISVLATALPANGGPYVWTRRALGPFWGFQQTWFALVASVFDMGIYPTLFAKYAGKLFPATERGSWPIIIASGVVVSGVLLNFLGVKKLGKLAVFFTALLLAPFVYFVILVCANGAVTAAPPPVHLTTDDAVTGIAYAMWNYMGWENAASLAGEVQRPQRTYPLALIFTLALVVFTYVIPVAAMALTGRPHTEWDPGHWATVARAYGGEYLEWWILFAAMVSAFGMYEALVATYVRLFVTMARDGWLPGKDWLTKIDPKTNVPRRALVVCGILWTFSLGFGLKKLITIDVTFYGLAIELLFLAHIVLLIRERELQWPFRVPGGLASAILIMIPPLGLIGYTIHANRSETMEVPFTSVSLSQLGLSLGIIIVGMVLALVRRKHYRPFHHGIEPAAQDAVAA